ncbi:serine hydrolase domain-containing protein [Roseibium aquae]|nr:serine hydrolase domain-containing protein [Roseibium aquae]
MRFATLLMVWLLAFGSAGPLKADPFVRLIGQGDTFAVVEAGSGAAADTPFAIASLGKTFTAVAVLRLVQRGAFGLDDEVARLVPPSTTDLFGGLPGVRLRHLLTMTSGLPDYMDDAWLDAVLEDPAVVQTTDGALRAAGGRPALFAPGERFDYSNTNYVLLGAILERATGLSYAAVLEAEVFEPAGLTDSFVFGSRPLPPPFGQGHSAASLVRRYYSGAGLGDGGVIASARDVARFYRALFAERSLLPDDLLTAMMADPAGERYGMGIEIEDGIAGHSGGDLGYSSDACMDLASGLVAVELVAAEDAITDWAWDQANRR